MFPRGRVEPDGKTERDKEELAEFGHGHEIFILDRNRPVPGKPGHSIFRMIINPAFGVGINHMG
jgi:hypothetical protein